MEILANNLDPKEWLVNNEWPDLPVDSDAFPHYTKLSEIMLQFAKEYHADQLLKSARKEETKFKKYL